MAEHYTILTDKGASKIAEAIRIGQKIEIAQMALGDGDGSLPKPQSSATSLVKERYRSSINSAKVDEHNNAWVIFEQVLAPDIGGWWIREVGLYDKDGDLIAIGNYPEQYKPLLTEGASTTQTVSIVIQVLSSDAITLKVDPSVVLATRQYVDEKEKEILSSLKEGLGSAASMHHSGKALDELVGSSIDVADTLQLVELRTKFQGLGGGATRSVSGDGDLITTDYLKSQCLSKDSSQSFTAPSDGVLRSVSGTELEVFNSGTYIVIGSVRAWAESSNISNAATLWLASFMCKGEQITQGKVGANTYSGNRDSTASICGVAKLNAGDIVSTGFMHHQGDAWDKVHLYSSLVMLRIGG